MGSIITPRRSYFNLPDEDTTVVPFSLTVAEAEVDDDELDQNVVERQSLVPQNNGYTTDYIPREPYDDQGILSRRTIFLAFMFALVLLVIIAVMGKQSPMSMEEESPTGAEILYASHAVKPPSIPEPMSSSPSNPAPPKPLPEEEETIASPLSPPTTENKVVFPDWAQQCASYYRPGSHKKHDHSFFEEGAHEEQVMAEWRELQPDNWCRKSLTYFLDSDYGLFFHLTAIAQAYSFAKLSDRSFFINDENWDRGRWTDHFQPIPDQGCLPPPPEKAKSCPRGTRHWAMNSKSIYYHFSHAYQEEFENPRAANVERRKPQFDLSRRGFGELLIPSDEVAELIALAREELCQTSLETSEDGETGSKPYMGVHIRRGDRHPWSWKHRSDYIPLEDFRNAIFAIWNGDEEELEDPPFLHIAAADSIISHVVSTFPPLQLNSLATTSNPTLRSLSLPDPYVQSEFALLTPEQRIQQTRGALVDFDLLVGGWNLPPSKASRLLDPPIAVVCTLSSGICRMAAVAMGWERAIEKGEWVNLDGPSDFDWKPTEV